MSKHVALSVQRRGSLPTYPILSAQSFGVDAFVTGRLGGASAPPYDSLNLGDHVGDEVGDVRENRRRVAAAAGVEETRLVIVRQVHGTNVLAASSATPSSEADALVSDRDDVALAILVADCVPLLFVDESSKHFAVVHAGWRGLRRGVINEALRQFENVTSLHVFLGPAISREAYQVGPEVAQHFHDVPGALVADRGDRSRLDLRRVATHQLTRAGVHDEFIEWSEQVTDGGDIFFSDRAARPCGRFALVAKRSS